MNLVSELAPLHRGQRPSSRREALAAAHPVGGSGWPRERRVPVGAHAILRHGVRVLPRRGRANIRGLPILVTVVASWLVSLFLACLKAFIRHAFAFDNVKPSYQRPALSEGLTLLNRRWCALSATTVYMGMTSKHTVPASPLPVVPLQLRTRAERGRAVPGVPRGRVRRDARQAAREAHQPLVLAGARGVPRDPRRVRSRARTVRQRHPPGCHR